MDVLCIGLAVCDLVARPVDASAFRRDSTRIDTLLMACGGDALNASAGMSALGLDVTLAARVGRDPMGDFLLSEMDRLGIRRDRVLVTNGVTTATSLVLVDASGERHFLYHGGANDRLALADLPLDRLSDFAVVHVGSAMALDGLDGPDLGRLFAAAKTAGCTTSLDVTWDASGRWLEKVADALPRVDVFLPNADEALRITGERDPVGMADFLHRRGVRLAAIKLGERGCYLSEAGEPPAGRLIPPVAPARVLDTTGAGDAFVAGFLAGLHRGLAPGDCALLGNAAASRCIGCLGALGGLPTLEGLVTAVEGSAENGRPAARRIREAFRKPGS